MFAIYLIDVNVFCTFSRLFYADKNYLVKLPSVYKYNIVAVLPFGKIKAVNQV